MVKYIIILILSFLFISIPGSVEAASSYCAGNYSCISEVSECRNSSGDICLPGPGCTCNTLCGTEPDIVSSCSGFGEGICTVSNPAVDVCVSTACGQRLSSWNCSWNVCNTSNCFNRPCTSGGQSCTCYGVCDSTAQCVTGGVVPGTCTGGSTPTPTPPPASTSTPTPTPTPTPIGGGPTPTSVPPTPTPGGGGCTSPNFWCSGPGGPATAVCCSPGQTCNSSIPSCESGSCTPTAPTQISGNVFIDGNRNGQWDGIFGGDTAITSGTVRVQSTSGTPFDETATVGGFGTYSTSGHPESEFRLTYNPTSSVVISGYNVLISDGCTGSFTFYPGFGPLNVTWAMVPQYVDNVQIAIDPGYTISGIVFNDTDRDGVRDAGEPLYAGGGLTVFAAGPTNKSDAMGVGDSNYSITQLSAGSYTVTLSGIPAGYTATTTNPVNTTLGPNRTIDFGIALNPPPDCPSEMTASTNTVDSGGSVDLSMSGCTDVEYPPDGSSPPPFDWDPPQDDNPSDEGDPQCSDGIDNDGDGLIDTNDPGCHWDGDSTNPGSYRPNDDNEGNVSGPRQCNDGVDNDNDGLVDIADPECHTDGNPDSDGDGVPDNDDGSFNPNDDNESDRVSEGTGGIPKSGSTTCSDSELVVINTTSTSSTATWTAPACATSQLICTITGVVNGPGGTDTYTEDITVRQTGVINVDVRDVSDGQPCDASAPLYTGSTTIGLSGAVSTTETLTDGTYTFACLPNGNYTVSLGLPAGYQMSTGDTSQATSITDGIKNRDIRFCIANWEPWYQTTQGDVRMRGIVNPIPAGFVGSTDATSPSVFFSTQYSADVNAGGSLSAKNWLVNREYVYNSLTRNRNGIVTYSFYKSRARQEGIPITELTSGILDNNNAEVLENGVYEWTGDMVIDGYSHIAERAVILVNGNVTINSEISVPVGSLLIVAASGNITVASTVGHASPNFNTTVPNLEGIYSAEGDIVLQGGDCAGGVPDERLNVAGALIANAQKPFASAGGGAVQNQRSLCVNDDLYPSLYVSTRPDFLTKLTDFYKVSYTKWREVRP